MSGFDYGATPDFDEVITAAVFLRMKAHENSILTVEDEKIKSAKDALVHFKKSV